MLSGVGKANSRSGSQGGRWGGGGQINQDSDAKWLRLRALGSGLETLLIRASLSLLLSLPSSPVQNLQLQSCPAALGQTQVTTVQSSCPYT